MSYGISIPSIGIEVGTLDAMKTATLVKIIECRAWSGSVSVPEYDSTKGFYIVRQIGTGRSATDCPRSVFNNSTKIFSWAAGGTGNINDITWSRKFNVYFFYSEGS